MDPLELIFLKYKDSVRNILTPIDPSKLSKVFTSDEEGAAQAHHTIVKAKTLV